MRRSGESASCLRLALLVDMEVFEALGECAGNLGGSLGQGGVGDGDARGAEQVVLAFAFGGVLLLQGGADLAVVAFDRGEGGVGQAFGEQGGGDAEEGVADADVLVQVGQRLAGFQGFQPERDLGQFGGHGVDVDAVDAAADHAAQRGPHDRVGRLGVAGLLGGDPLGDPAGGGDEEVPGAAGGVADGEAEQRRDALFRPFRARRPRRAAGRGRSRAGTRPVRSACSRSRSPCVRCRPVSAACRRAARRRSAGSVPAGTRRRCRVPRRRGCRSPPAARRRRRGA